MENYRLTQKNILNLLSGNMQWFSNCVHNNYGRYAREYHFELKTSQLRLREAFALWHQDIDRTLKHGISESVELDPYKQAGFLAYWLRRRVVVNDIELYSEPGDPNAPKLEHYQDTLPLAQGEFLRFYNEICAFRLGLDLTIYHAANEYVNGIVSQGISESEAEQRSVEFIRSISSRGESLVIDTAVLMKQKNLSPHALYIIYKSLASPQLSC